MGIVVDWGREGSGMLISVKRGVMVAGVGGFVDGGGGEGDASFEGVEDIGGVGKIEDREIEVCVLDVPKDLGVLIDGVSRTQPSKTCDDRW
jgi:hypothetical protein